jgi:N-acetylmuramoyl-L-alanine amidase
MIVRPFATLLLVLFAASAGAAPVAVQDARLWAGPDSTRVVFDLSGSTPHELSTLQDPERVVIDLPSARVDSRLSRAPDGAGLVRAVRIGERDGGALRIVLDLDRRARATAFVTPPNETYGYRLVVDLAPAEAPKPIQVPHAPQGTRDLVIAVDAGHGGEDPGAIGRGGTREKDVTLQVARRLVERLNAEPGMRAVLTRSGDYFVPLRERINRARRLQADMFVSVHADAFTKRSVRGSSVYVLSARGASDEAARWLADKENSADLVGGVSLDGKDDVLASVLLDLSQNAAISASQDAASKVLVELDRVGELKKSQVQHAGFIVLKSPDIPSMLVETGFISNPDEERRLRDPDHQSRIAAAIHAGVRGYYYDNPPPGTRVALLAARERGRPLRHIVARGETLADVAGRYDVPVDALRRANSLGETGINAGTVLEIPSGTSF